MRALLLSSEKKVHWRGDTEKRHDAVIDTIGTLPVESIVVVRLGGPGEKDERKRRKCFETYIPTLVGLGCSRLTLESRGPHDDRRDMAMLDALRASCRVDSTLQLEHAPGPADPALWIADAVCGAVVSQRIGQPRWLKALERQSTSRWWITDHRHDASPGPCRPAGSPEAHFRSHRDGAAHV